MSPSRFSPRRWLRFSIRSLLLAVLVIGTALGWTLHKVREQGIAVAALEELDCRVGYAFAEPQSVVERLRGWLGEEYPRNVLYVSGGPKMTDAGMVHLRGLPRLKELRISFAQITDAGVANLRGLTQLETLVLDDCRVTDAGLANLELLTQLKALSLDRTQVTDGGLVHLESLPNLEDMYLERTQVTDTGLEHLDGLWRLRFVGVRQTQVTDAAAEKLGQTLPRCIVVN